MTAKGPRASDDEDSSQQPRQERTPSVRERRSVATEDHTSERQNLSDKKPVKKRDKQGGAA